MIPRAAVLLVLLLAACGPAESPAQQACDRAADDDPEVKRLIMVGLGNPNFQETSQGQLREAKRQAELRCLRSRGLAPKGGVERPKPVT